MLPTDLTAEQFRSYPPLAQRLAVSHLAALRQLPLSFLPSLLRELIEYDDKFPAERAALDSELATITAFSPAQTANCFRAFAQIRLSSTQERLDWVGQPAEFTEELSAFLWSSHQMDAFQKAATDYGNRMHTVTETEALPLPRLGIVVIGQGVASYNGPLFRKLREHGTYFGSVDPSDGLQQLLAVAAKRAQAHPLPYGHWYIEGGEPAAYHPSLTCVSYAKLEPARSALLKRIETEAAKPGMGPEALRNHIARLTPAELGLTGDLVLNRFQVKVLTEGSGTQIFSTTFAQWTAREALRRAEPLTLLVRYSPRQRQRPMNELLSSSTGKLAVDPVSSLIDADMGAWYQWINQQRLPGAMWSSFVVWLEGQNRAVAIGPSLPRGTESKSAINLKTLLSLALA